MSPILLAADLPRPVAAGWQLILAALVGIALIVVLITVAKLHPFLALIFGSLAVGSVAGENPEKVLKSFADGFGSTAASVGILIALGAMFAKLLHRRVRGDHANRFFRNLLTVERSRHQLYRGTGVGRNDNGCGMDSPLHQLLCLLTRLHG